ncbi:hypothetical protein NFX46_20815 [Streptomyces phaeoluteigriseus]|uniref:Uncharacterized protein n=1 Tax=Streptomyces phaeoluteigriseus TaxID=114686 RepID=A0ABY4ZA79_9ACTN|nr:hypothetical protein [Streptomyces phaeoluteigriseus]USQ85948.1 hypothetical protein NFX46_20815 [Streptomyces phaeoluteigriseus]
MHHISPSKRLKSAAATVAMAAGIALFPAASASAAPTTVDLGGMKLSASVAAVYECPRIHTTDNYAYTWCRVYSGKVRLIADCASPFPDIASGWITPKAGNPTQRLQAGPCVNGMGPNSGPQGAS